MKRFLLFMAICSLLISCQREGGILEGSTWICEQDGYNGTARIELKEGYASLFVEYRGNSKLYDTQSFTIKGNKIHFKDNLYIVKDYEYDEFEYLSKEGTFNEDKSKLELYDILKVDGEESIEKVTFIRYISQ